MTSSAKKLKTCPKSFQLSNRTNCSSLYANMAADLFFKICSHLDLKDICKIGRACVRWYLLTRSEIVWYRTDIAEHGLTPEAENKLICSLPSYVEQLKLGYVDQLRIYRSNSVWEQSLKLPDIFLELRKRCAKLNALIIENALLFKSSHERRINGGYMMNCKVPEKEQVLRFYGELKCETEETDTDYRAFHYILSNVSELSLRKSIFAVDDIFPSEDFEAPSSKIKVLDLTKSLSATDRAVVWFCRLPYLEEIYLAGTAVTINGVIHILKTRPHLKVIDLDSTVVGGETFTVLKKYGKSLTHIFISETAVKDYDLMDLDVETFPNLEMLCLASSRVTEVGVQKVLNTLPALKSVKVNESNVSTDWLLDLDLSDRVKVEYVIKEDDGDCEHFLENKYNGVFKNHHYASSYKHE